jgi:hypothetical protein
VRQPPPPLPTAPNYWLFFFFLLCSLYVAMIDLCRCSYERASIEAWLALGKTTSPKTGAELCSKCNHMACFIDCASPLCRRATNVQFVLLLLMTFIGLQV